jgi:hypothetical protein
MALFMPFTSNCVNLDLSYKAKQGHALVVVVELCVVCVVMVMPHC